MHELQLTQVVVHIVWDIAASGSTQRVSQDSTAL